MTRLTRFSNNAVSKLAANLSNVGLAITLTPGDGAKFPALSGGQVFFGTLAKVDGTKEVVKVTARATDTLTIVRAVEAVAGIQTAFAFLAGDAFELRMTAGSLGDELDRLDAAAFMNVLNKTTNYTIVEADVCSLVKTDTTAGNITITLPQISTLVGSFEIQVQKNTADANTVNVARAGSDTINGLTSYSISAQYQSVWLVADLASNTWTAITSASASNRVVDSFVGTGVAGPFTLSGDPGSKNNTDVYVNNVYQRKSTYTVTGTQLTLGSSVTIGEFVECLWTQPLAIGTPSDDTVTTPKIVDGAITAEKFDPTAVTSFSLTALASATAALWRSVLGIAPRAARIDVASVAGTVDLTANAPDTDDIQLTGSLVITAFTVAIGRVIRVRCSGSPTLTNNANIITQTGANIVCAAGDTFMLRATAANVVEVLDYVTAKTLLFATTTNSMVRVNTANGYGSTNTMIRRFTNVVTNQGSDITYADSATLGATFTINTNGVYAVSFNDSYGSTEHVGISKNSTQLTTQFFSITLADKVAAMTTAGTNLASNCGVTLYLTAGDVIRAHTTGYAFAGASASMFTITRVA
jgi:hypothetical protein